MAGVLGLNNASSEDIDSRTGEKSKLKTGNLKRRYNMPKACVEKKMKQGMSKSKAIDACYPKASKITKAGLKLGLLEEKEPPKKKKNLGGKKGKKSKEYR